MKAQQIFAVCALFASVSAYYSGEIRTREPFRYGKFKTRMQGSGQKGTVASLFTFWNGQEDLDWSVREWEEIDIELVPSKEENPFFTNIIYRNRAMDGEYYRNFDPSNDWHEYEIVWKPNYIAWSVNGVEVRRETNTESVRDQDKWSLLYMNFWTPTWDDWGGGRDDSTMPWYTKYDYIEAYDYDEASGNFNLRFRDDFDTLDRNIWRVSDNWGFPDNSSQFMENHTYVQDGNLILKLDHTYGPPQPNPDPPSPSPSPSPSPTPTPTPTPTPDPTPCPDGGVTLDAQALHYGDKCDSRHDWTECNDCSSTCHKSWPAIDPNGWMSSTAHCRCLPDQLAADAYSYGYVAKDSKAGTCGDSCDDCRWSWPADCPLKWKSDRLMARCMPAGMTPYDPANDNSNDGGDDNSNDGGNNDESQQEDTYADWRPEADIQFSNSCINLYDMECGENCTSCNWSWPAGDPASWQSDEAACRCQEKKTFIWGEQCASLSEGLCGAFCTECRQANLFTDGDNWANSTCRCKTWGEPN